MQEINAKITKAHLGFESHGLLSSTIFWEGEVDGGSFGGLHLGGPGMALWVGAILRVFGYEDWSQLKGTLIRVRYEESFGGRVLAIGHILEDKWASMDEILAQMDEVFGRREAAA